VEESLAFAHRLKAECAARSSSSTRRCPAGRAVRAVHSGRGFAPQTLEAEPRWSVSCPKDPQTPWLSPALQRRILDFELVIKSRFPTETDIRFTRPSAPREGAVVRRWTTRHTAAPTSCAPCTAWRSCGPAQGFDALPARDTARRDCAIR
jgi:hypothetical protein